MYKPSIFHHAITKGWIVSDQDKQRPSDEFLQHHTVEQIETTKAAEEDARHRPLWIDYFSTATSRIIST